jgi:signal transduction histidine kinase
MSMGAPYDYFQSRILRQISVERQLAFAQISAELVCFAVSENLNQFLSEPLAENALTGRPLGELFWEFIGLEEELSAVLRGEIPGYTIENAQRDEADGSFRYLILRVIPLNESAPADGLLLIVEDNTKIATLEQQFLQERNSLRLTQHKLERANQELTLLDMEKSLFLSIAAHDVRAPLAAIRGAANLVQMDLADSADKHKDAAEFTATIISQADHLNRLVSDLLDLDQIQKGKLSIRRQYCDLIAIIRQVCNAMQNTANLPGVGLAFSSEISALGIQTDPDRVRQIFYNLVGNAIKYTHMGGQVSVTCVPEGEHCLIRVTDTGRGIAPEELEHVFSLYFRTQDAMHSQVRGIGLGLYIVKHLVEALGGEISVTSQLQQGTTFSVRLPLNTTAEG